ncbi:MAG: S8 family serine peptidase [Bacteroidales bacterium]|nr:S8 family serine peptidase [Candidatus Liminaster caballi]
MKRLRLYILLAAMAITIIDMTAANRYRLYLKDKAGSQYCALSERAMQRRLRQGIELDSTDLEVSPTYINRLRKLGFNIVSKSRWLNTVVVERQDGSAISLESFKHLSFVVRHEPVEGLGYEYDALTQTAMSQTRHTSKREAERKLGDASGTSTPRLSPSSVPNNKLPLTEVHGDALIDNGYRGQGMLIAVLDGGFMNANTVYNLCRNVIGWYDMYDPEGNTYEMFYGEDHGAMCLSVMTSDSTTGIWGTAPDAEYFLIRTEYSLTECPIEEDMWVAGAEMADSIGADLISSSLGYYEFDNSAFNHTQSDLTQGTVFISRGAAIAASKGMLICNAAGNEGQTAWGTIDFPSDAEDVLSVGATDAWLNPSYFSSPGFTSPYVKPDVCCRGSAVPAYDPYLGDISAVYGTSFACPLLCGLCASLWSAVPSLTPAQIRTLVRESGSLADNPTAQMGYGIPDFSVILERAFEIAEPKDPDAISQPQVIEKRNVTDCGQWYDMQGRRVGKPVRKSMILIQNGTKKVLLAK